MTPGGTRASSGSNIFSGLFFLVQLRGRARTDFFYNLEDLKSNGAIVSRYIHNPSLTHIIVSLPEGCKRNHRHFVARDRALPASREAEDFSLSDIVDHYTVRNSRCVVLQAQWVTECILRGRVIGPEDDWGGWRVLGTHDPRFRSRDDIHAARLASVPPAGNGETIAPPLRVLKGPSKLRAPTPPRAVHVPAFRLEPSTIWGLSSAARSTTSMDAPLRVATARARPRNDSVSLGILSGDLPRGAEDVTNSTSRLTIGFRTVPTLEDASADDTNSVLPAAQHPWRTICWQTDRGTEFGESEAVEGEQVAKAALVVTTRGSRSPSLKSPSPAPTRLSPQVGPARRKRKSMRDSSSDSMEGSDFEFQPKKKDRISGPRRRTRTELRIDHYATDPRRYALVDDPCERCIVQGLSCYQARPTTREPSVSCALCAELHIPCSLIYACSDASSSSDSDAGGIIVVHADGTTRVQSVDPLFTSVDGSPASPRDSSLQASTEKPPSPEPPIISHPRPIFMGPTHPLSFHLRDVTNCVLPMLIKTGGGVLGTFDTALFIIVPDDPGTRVTVPPDRYALTRVVSAKWIWDCAQAMKILDPTTYLVHVRDADSGPAVQMSTPRTASPGVEVEHEMPLCVAGS